MAAAEAEADASRPAERSELHLDGVNGGPAVAGAAVRAIASLAGISPRRLTGVRAIVEELVIEAGARPTAVERNEITVRTAIESGVLGIEVIDRALPVGPNDDCGERSRQLAALGYVDSLSVEAHGRDGNIARCELRLDPQRLGAASGLVERVVPEDAPRASDEEAEALDVRVMRAEDAPELVRCVYRCYGYSYIDPLLYDPHGIARAIEAEEMTSIVAVAPDGTVAGHSAMWTDEADDQVPEAGKLVVDPRFRGHGLAVKLATRRREVAVERGYFGIWSEAVTNHSASQREVIKLGGSETGLLIGAAVPTAMAGFESSAGEGVRRSLLAYYTPLRPHHENVYVPDRHAELVAELAQRLRVDRTISAGEAAAEGTETELTSAVHTFSGLGSIRIGRVGADLRDHVADTLDSYEAFDLAAVHLDLPLADPGAAAAAEDLERLGFCFAAWMPAFYSGHDGLRLQRLGSRPVDTETIECARPEGEAVRDYVLADWHRIRRGEF